MSLFFLATPVFISINQQTHHDTQRMQCFTKLIYPSKHLVKRTGSRFLNLRYSKFWEYSTMLEDDKLSDFLNYMEKLKNYERMGVPKDAGTDSVDGFDLGRMKRLLERLGNPHTHFRAIHVAGTKGKGSTVAFLSNILQEGGYSVGCYTSPHLLTIRERISFANGEPVSAEMLMNLFYRVKEVIDQSIDLENGSLTYFEVFTALSFAIFSQAKVDIAIIEAGLGGARDATNVLRNTELIASVITSIGEEHLAALGGSLENIAIAKAGIIKHGRPLVIGGSFESHIECIIRDKAVSMNSPLVSACDPGIRSHIKCFGSEDNKPYQICDIIIQIHKDIKMFIELSNVKLRMLGKHQLQNAVTAICTTLCMRNQGFMISDKSIQAGLERTKLLGRSQFLSNEEAKVVGVTESLLLVDGAHTEASAKGLSDVIKMTNPCGSLALVVAMASDKDHLAFARQLLTGHIPEIILLTEVSIAGGNSRAIPASTLKDIWIRASKELGSEIRDLGIIDRENSLDDLIDRYSQELTDNKPVIFVAHQNLEICDTLRAADQFLKLKGRDGTNHHLIVVTGSLHIVSSVLAAVGKKKLISI